MTLKILRWEKQKDFFSFPIHLTSLEDPQAMKSFYNFNLSANFVRIFSIVIPISRYPSQHTQDKVRLKL